MEVNDLNAFAAENSNILGQRRRHIKGQNNRPQSLEPRQTSLRRTLPDYNYSVPPPHKFAGRKLYPVFRPTKAQGR